MNGLNIGEIMASDTLLRIPFTEGKAREQDSVVDGQLHPTKSWILLACASGTVATYWSASGETLHQFEVDQAKYGVLKSARFFDADCLVHVDLLPPNLVGEARLSLIVAICAKGIVVYDCVTRISTPYAPPVLATGSGHAKSSGGALSGAVVGVSCEHIVVGTTFGSLFTFNVRTGVVSAFSGTTKLHEKSIVGLLAITGRPSQQLHRSRIVTGCAGGIVAVWEIPCETPIYKSGPRVLVQNPAAPVLDLRFDPARNRLACCFGNGSAMVWAFEEHTQEEAVVVSIAKGFAGGQIAIPRGTWNAPDESLLMITPGQGNLALVLPSATAIRNAKQLLKGVVAATAWESKSSNSLTGMSEAIVAVRILLSLTPLSQQSKTSSGESKRISRFWQHPLDPNMLLIATIDGEGRQSVYFSTNNQNALPMQHDLLTGSNKVITVVDSRLVTKSGGRYQTEKIVAWLSPYVTPDQFPKSVKDWGISSGDMPGDILNALDSDKPVEALWPGPVSVFPLKRDDDSSLILGLVWPDAHRYVIANLRLSRRQSSGTDSPQSGVAVLQFGGGDALAFTTPPSSTSSECIALIGRREEVVTGSSTAITESRGSRSMMSLPSFKSSRSFRSSPAAATTSSSSFLASKSKKDEATKTVVHYRLGAVKVNLADTGSSSSRMRESPPPFTEILMNQPVRELVADFGEADVFMMRCDPPEQLARTLKPWTRFFRLNAFVRDKALVHAGPLLPAHRLVAKWEHEVQGKRLTTLALSFEQILDRVAVLDVIDDGVVKYRCSVFTQSFTPCISLKLHLGTIFFVTSDKVHIAFVGMCTGKQQDDCCPTYVLATRGRNAHPEADSGHHHHHHNHPHLASRKDSLHVHDEASRPEDAAFAPSPSLLRQWEGQDADDTAIFPISVLRPFLHDVVLLGVDRDSGDLLLLVANGKATFVSLKHPLVRVGMLAAAGLGGSALKWTHSLDTAEQVRDEAALLLAKLGFFREAALVPRANPVLLLDICVRYHCVDQALSVFDPKTKAFARLNQESISEEASGLTNYQRLALFLASEGRKDAISSFLPRLKNDREREFCSALVTVGRAVGKQPAVF